MKAVIINYGAGNITSLRHALLRLGLTDVSVSNIPEEIQMADKVFFPGVGHAAFAMDQLKRTKLDQLIPQLQQPVLGICLGMQLLCAFSEEGNTTGLGIFDQKVKRFDHGLKIPHMGWNNVHSNDGFEQKSWYYFVHSYYVEMGRNAIGTAHYGEQSFSAVLHKDNFLACQFHPEKSGAAGSRFLKKFIEL